jgi:DNA-binding transcriptional ArsR family regulator
VIPCDTRWTCIDTAAVAILDVRFLAAARRWAELMTVIFGRLTDQLGNLIGAKRSTVSLALAALSADKLIRRDETGNWRLAHHSVEALRPTPRCTSQALRARVTAVRDDRRP